LLEWLRVCPAGHRYKFHDFEGEESGLNKSQLAELDLACRVLDVGEILFPILAGTAAFGGL
jgi:hypothetical protein